MVDVAHKPKILIKRILPPQGEFANGSLETGPLDELLTSLQNSAVKKELFKSQPVKEPIAQPVKEVTKVAKQLSGDSHSESPNPIDRAEVIKDYPSLVQDKSDSHTDVDNTDDNESTCPICQEALICNDLVRLHCFHAFHYNCILDWYKAAQKSDRNIKQTCPMCREHGGYLPLKFGDMPIVDIHHPSYCKKLQKNKNPAKVVYNTYGGYTNTNTWTTLSDTVLHTMNALPTQNVPAQNVVPAQVNQNTQQFSPIFSKCTAIIKSKSSKKFGQACGNTVVTVNDGNNPSLKTQCCGVHSKTWY